jgi:ABC-2 type transport system permease protein
VITGLGHSLVRLRALLGKEFLQLLRDPRMRFFVVVPPLVQLIIFGYAASFDVKNASVAVVDQSHSYASRNLLSAIHASGHFSLHYFATMSQASAAMDRSEVRAIMRFPADFEQRRAIALAADGSDSNSALLVVGQLSETLRHRSLMDAERSPPIRIEYRAWFNPNLEDRLYFVPGIIANVVLIATMMLTAMAVVREREVGTLERLLVTPLARFEFVLGKIIPVACVGLFDVILVSTIAVVWFHVPFRGDPFALLLGTLLYLMSTLGLGLLISSYSNTQQQAMLMAFFFLMPLVILSGFAFPIRNMPESVQWLTWLDPLRYFLVVIRDSFLKAGTIGDHGFEFGMMALLGAVALLLSLLRIR